MYRRANLSRTVVLVVALLLAAVSTGAFAREFGTPDPQGGNHPTRKVPRGNYPGGVFHTCQFSTEQEQTGTGANHLDRTNVALIGTVPPVLIARLRRVE